MGDTVNTNDNKINLMSKEEIFNIIHAEEIAEAAKREQALNESIQNIKDFIAKQSSFKADKKLRSDYQVDVMKSVICECMSNLYLASLVIDNPETYEDNLRTAMVEQCVDIMSDIEYPWQFGEKFKNASVYIKDMVRLAEDISNNKSDDDFERYKEVIRSLIESSDDDKEDVEFPRDVLINKDDLALIEKFEETEGKDIFADEIQARVLDVYKAEDEQSKERNEKIQTTIDMINSVNKDNPVNENVELALRSVNNGTPTSVFNAIFINKSKMIINESGIGDNLSDHADQIIAETISTYTLLECIHSLGFKTFSDNDREKLKSEFQMGM